MDGDPVKDLEDEAMRLLESRGLKPRAVPKGSVRELLGGLACMDLEEGDNIDSALLMVRGRLSKPEPQFILNLDSGGVHVDAAMLLARGDALEPGLLCRIDYAVRGDLQGLQPGRRIASLSATWEGLLRKKLKDHRWVVPREQESKPYYSLGADGAPPGPGEVWEGGPHQVLAGLLNGDDELMERVRGLAARHGDVNPLLEVFSDRWGESLRVSGGLWVRPHELATVHASEQYLEAVDSVCGHLRETRRRFGGLTF
jgi:hypothetical protein